VPWGLWPDRRADLAAQAPKDCSVEGGDANASLREARRARGGLPLVEVGPRLPRGLVHEASTAARPPRWARSSRCWPPAALATPSPLRPLARRPPPAPLPARPSRCEAASSARSWSTIRAACCRCSRRTRAHVNPRWCLRRLLAATLTGGMPKAGRGATAAELATTAGDDHTTQVVYHGHPLDRDAETAGRAMSPVRAATSSAPSGRAGAQRQHDRAKTTPRSGWLEQPSRSAPAPQAGDAAAGRRSGRRPSVDRAGRKGGQR
jgi:hypothetical protein